MLVTEDNFTLITADKIVAHFNEFKRKKFRKRDFTYENVYSATGFATNMATMRFFSRSDEPKVAEYVEKQRAEHEKAIAQILGK